MEDNVYKTSSERLITPPESQIKKINDQKVKYERERPILMDLLDYLNKQVAFYESVGAIKNTDDSFKFMCEVTANKRIVEILRREIDAVNRMVRMFDKA